MYHLPQDRAKIKVWPTPGALVAAHAPRADVQGVQQMQPDGQVVEWDGFRYRQYLGGEIHFHDPRPTEKVAAEELARREQARKPHLEHEHDVEKSRPAWLREALAKLPADKKPDKAEAGGAR